MLLTSRPSSQWNFGHMNSEQSAERGGSCCPELGDAGSAAGGVKVVVRARSNEIC